MDLATVHSGRKIKKKKRRKKRETIQRFVLLQVKINLELAGTTQEASQGECTQEV